MAKRFFSLLLSLLLVISFGTSAFAANYTDNVDVAATIQAVIAGTPMSAETGSDVSVSKNSSDAFPAFDFRCVLDMQNVRNKFSEYYTNWMSILNYAGSNDRIDELNSELQNMRVTGNFTAEIVYPNTVTIPAEFLVSGQMVGMDDNAKQIFGNDTRTVTPGINANTLTITFSLVGTEAAGRPGYVVASDLFANVNTYLADFSLFLGNVGTSVYGTHTVQGKLTGTTVAQKGEELNFLTITYQTNPEYANANATVTEKNNRPYPTSTPKPTATPGSTSAPSGSSCEISFIIDGEDAGYAPITKAPGSTVSPEELPVPYRDGYAFTGWFTDEACTNPITEEFQLSEDMSLFAGFKSSVIPSTLNGTDHFAYIIGYPDGTVRPTANITREEVATIFFRLLNAATKEKIASNSNNFSDVVAGRWSNEAISTLANGNILNGYADGSFRPDAPITRAEFAAIASRLDAMIEGASHNFSDLSGHWAEAYIANALAKGWITGYEDGSFRPEQYITRAEAMTIANRMLKRFLEVDGYHSNAIIWPDNPKDAWFHLAVIEATNGHDYDRKDNSVYESWTDEN